MRQKTTNRKRLLIHRMSRAPGSCNCARGTNPTYDWNNMRICTVDGCTDAHNAKGLCNTHYHRMRRNGTLSARPIPPQSGQGNFNWRGDNAAYTTVHSRLVAARGKAARLDCVDCGGRARDWAYTNDCPNEKPSKFGPYSTDLGRYQPMCTSCHHKFDYKAGLVPA